MFNIPYDKGNQVFGMQEHNNSLKENTSVRRQGIGFSVGHFLSSSQVKPWVFRLGYCGGTVLKVNSSLSNRHF